MIGNLLTFLLVIALLVLFGWLTVRALRARRVWVKIVGGLLAGVLTLVLAAATFFAGKGLAMAYIAPAPAPEITVAGTPEQIARGEYLVNIACVGCHSANFSGQFPLVGGADFSGEIPMPIGSIVAANITPGGVLAERSDGELFRALRHGFGPNGRLALMSFMPYRQLSDEDTEAIIAFLRAQEPVTTADNGGDRVNLLGAIVFYGAEMIPMPESPEGVVIAPAAGTTADYGQYVATFGECRGCHGTEMTGAEATAVSEAVPNPRPAVSEWSLDQFAQTMRTGVKPDGSTLEMPWENASKMNDEDLAALYTYLRAAP